MINAVLWMEKSDDEEDSESRRNELLSKVREENYVQVVGKMNEMEDGERKLTAFSVLPITGELCVGGKASLLRCHARLLRRATCCAARLLRCHSLPLTIETYLDHNQVTFHLLRVVEAHVVLKFGYKKVQHASGRRRRLF